jgi:hypothetical protein
MCHRSRLTRSPLFHLLRHHRKNSKDLSHNLHDNILHRLCCRDFGISLEPSEEILNALEDFHKQPLVRNDVYKGSLSERSK